MTLSTNVRLLLKSNKKSAAEEQRVRANNKRGKQKSRGVCNWHNIMIEYPPPKKKRVARKSKTERNKNV